MADAKKRSIRINYARPSFMEGMARLMDFGGALDDYDIPYLDDLRAGRVPDVSVPEIEPGAEAIHECWVTVGNHLRSAMGVPLVDPSKKRALRMQARRQLNEPAE